MNDLKNNIRKKINDLGFDFVSFTKPVIDKETKLKFKTFLDKNYHGDMKWLERHYEKKNEPRKLWDEVKTVVVIALNYSPKYNPILKNDKNDFANISVYAGNEDYHKVIYDKLNDFKVWFKKEYNLESKIFVDSAPLMEKYFAKMSNIGWQGKHTNIVSKKFGSWLFLSEIFLSIEIQADVKSSDNCGSCTNCLDICPTNALYDSYKIDARKCISYLTIEYKGPIPISLRKKIGNKVYGCDDCLAVCPWNKFTLPTKKYEFINKNEKYLNFFLEFDEIKFNKYFKKSPIKRIGWVSFMRNVILVCGNSRLPEFIYKLKKFLDNRNPIIRGITIWAINELMEGDIKEVFKKIKEIEKNKYVLFELNSLN